MTAQSTQVRSDTGPFAVVPEWLVYSSASDRAVRLFAILARHDGPGGAFPGRRRLQEILACSERTLDRAVDELEALGALVVHTRWRLPSGDIVEGRRPPQPGAVMSSNRYELRHVDARKAGPSGGGDDTGSLDAGSIPAPASTTNEGVGSRVAPGGVMGDATVGPRVTPGGVMGDARNERSSNERSEIDPSSASRASPGRNAQAVADLVAEGEREQRIARAFVELREAVTDSSRIPESVNRTIGLWSQFVTLEDVQRIRREVEDAGREQGTVVGWRYVEELAGRVSRARRSGVDPWGGRARGGAPAVASGVPPGRAPARGVAPQRRGAPATAHAGDAERGGFTFEPPPS